MAPESCINVSLCKQRAQGKPGAGCTRSLVCSEESTRVSHYRFNRDTRPSLRNGVNGVVRALPGVRDLIVTVVRGITITRDLSTSPGVPGPHASAVRSDITRQSISSASVASRPTFVTTRTPLLPRRDDITIIINFRKAEAEYFCNEGLTRIRESHLSGKSPWPINDWRQRDANVRRIAAMTCFRSRLAAAVRTRFGQAQQFPSTGCFGAKRTSNGRQHQQTRSQMTHHEHQANSLRCRYDHRRYQLLAVSFRLCHYPSGEVRKRQSMWTA
jgi:hypothetical protein